MRIRHVLALGLIGAVLSACSSIIPDPKPANTIYRLQSTTEPVAPKSDAKVFRIDRPATPGSLRGDAIIVSQDGSTYMAAGQANWSEDIPSLIQLSFVDELAGHEDLVGILPTTGARTEYRVHLTVRSFEARFDRGTEQAPLAVVHYVATVADASSRDLIGTYTVKKTQRASSVAVSSIVTATQAANASALGDIIAWMKTLELES